MSSDSQGRPLSDDGQWAWNGTEWVPAAGGPAAPEASGAAPAEDVGATMIVQTPFPGGVAGPAPQGGAPGYGQAPAYGQAPGYGQVPAYGQAPGYGAGAPGSGSGYGAPGAPGAPGGYGVPPQQPKSRKPLIIIVAGLIVIAAAVVVVVLLTGGGSSKVSGKYNCTVLGETRHGTITFGPGNSYSISGGAPGGTTTRNGSKLAFTGGSLAGVTGTVSDGGKHVVIKVPGTTLDCKR